MRMRHSKVQNALIFYEKPGCVGNQRQKALLHGQGYNLEVRNLLSEAWTVGSLRPFFAAKPVREWFNLSAPRVKSGELAIERLSEQEALELMLKEPLLICRPLLQYGNIRQSGFVPGPVLEALSVDLETETGEDLQTCPMN